MPPRLGVWIWWPGFMWPFHTGQYMWPKDPQSSDVPGFLLFSCHLRLVSRSAGRVCALSGGNDVSCLKWCWMMLISLLVFLSGDLIHKSPVAPVGLFYLYSLDSSVCLKDIHYTIVYIIHYNVDNIYIYVYVWYTWIYVYIHRIVQYAYIHDTHTTYRHNHIYPQLIGLWL